MLAIKGARDKHAGRSYTHGLGLQVVTHMSLTLHINLFIYVHVRITQRFERTLTCIANQSLQSNYVFSERCLCSEASIPHAMRCLPRIRPSPAGLPNPVHYIHTLPQCEGRPLSKAHTQKHARVFREQCSRISRAMSRQRPRKWRIHGRRLQAGLL